MRKHDKGFTIVEVLITVVIIAALAGLILPKFMNQTEQGVASEAITMMGHIRKQVLFYYDHASAWPVTGDEVYLRDALGMEFPESANGWTYKGERIRRGGIDDYLITAVNGLEDNVTAPDNFIALRVLTGEWTCQGSYTSLALKHVDLIGTGGGKGTKPIEQ